MCPRAAQPRISDLTESCVGMFSTHAAQCRGQELAELSSLARDTLLFPVIVHSPPVADIRGLYVMPPPSARSKRGTVNGREAPQVKRCKPAGDSTRPSSSLGTNMAATVLHVAAVASGAIVPAAM